MPRWLYIITLPHQGIPIAQIIICTHRLNDYSVITKWQTKVALSLSYQAGQPEPTVGPTHLPGSIAGRCWVTAGNFKKQSIRDTRSQSLSDVFLTFLIFNLTFVKTWWHRRQRPDSAAISYESGDTAEALITTGMVD